MATELDAAADSDALWLREADVTSLIDLPDAIGAVRHAHLRWGSGQLRQLTKTLLLWDGGTLHATGAVGTDSGLAVAKTWTHTPGGATPIVVCWSALTGRLLAVIEAFALGQLRTSAVSATATDVLAAPSCDVLGVIGTGRQAEGQIAAVAAVRPVRRIVVHSPNPQHREDFAELIAACSGIPTVAASSVDAAAGDAQIVVTVTRSREPFLTAAMLAPDAHVNAVGAISTERAELDADLVASAGAVVSDDVAAARALAPRELAALPPDGIRSLAEVLADVPAQRGLRGRTVFKAVGSGVSDLAVAELVLARARAAGRGRAIPKTVPSRPSLWRSR
jgi:ornithine cyclodeaminase